MAQKYVIAKNVTEVPLGFSTFGGGRVTLDKIGARKSELKILIDEEREEEALRYYKALREVPGLVLTFSENTPLPEDKLKRLVVTTPDNVNKSVLARVDFMRKKQEKESKAKRLTDSRLARAKAEAAIKAGKSSKEVDKAVKDAFIREPIPADDPDLAEVTLPEEGVELSPEVVKAMSDHDLLDIAKQLEVATEGIERAAVEEAILAASAETE